MTFCVRQEPSERGRSTLALLSIITKSTVHPLTAGGGGSPSNYPASMGTILRNRERLAWRTRFDDLQSILGQDLECSAAIYIPRTFLVYRRSEGEPNSLALTVELSIFQVPFLPRMDPQVKFN